MRGFLLVLALFISQNIHSNIPSGSTAEDWTLKDTNGNTHSLYADYLDQGWSVVLDLNATWAGPSWSFHNSGVMNNLYQNYGPNGQRTVMPLSIEVDPNTNQDCFYGPNGCNDYAIGNRASGAQYPQFNPPSAQAHVLNLAYDVTKYPQIYVIAPSGYVQAFSGTQTNYQEIESWAAESFQMEKTSYTLRSQDCSSMDLDLHPVGGHGTISYAWSNGAITEDLSDLDAGDYTVTMTDANGYNWQVGPITISGPSDITIGDVAITDINCAGTDSGIISLTNNSPNYSYTWSNGQSGTTISNLGADQYILTVTDLSTGCSAVSTYKITTPTALDVNYSVSDAACGRDAGSIQFNTNGGTPPYTYVIAGQTVTDGFLALIPGTYSAQISDANGCTDQVSFAILDSEGLTAKASVQGQLNCNNSSVVLSVDGSTIGQDISYIWRAESGLIVGTSEDITVTSEGTYTLTVENTILGCNSQSTVEVTSNRLVPTARVTASNNISCTETSAMISSTGSSMGSNFSYQWTSVNGIISGSTTGVSISVNSAGLYQLEVINNDNGCTNTALVSITQSGNLPIIKLSGDTSFCEGSSSSLCVSIGTNESVEWLENGIVVANSPCITSAEAKTYQVRLKNNDTTCEAVQELVTTITDLPRVSINSPTALSCNQSTVELSAEIINGSSYTWSDASGFILGHSEKVIVNTVGEYTLTVWNEDGCSSSANVNIIALDEAVAEARFSFTNSEFDFEFQDVSDGDITEYNWSFGDGTSSNEVNPIHKYAEAGYYEVCLETINACGSTSACQQVLAAQQLQSELEYSNVSCAGIEDGSAVITSTGGLSDYSYKWSNAALSGSSITNLETGNYSVVVTDITGMQTELSFIITEPEPLSIEAIITNTASSESNGAIILDIFGGTGSYKVMWENDGDGTALGAGDHLVTVTDENGCSITETFTVSSVSSTNEIAGLSNFLLSPNPASDKTVITASLESTTDIQISLISMLGQRQVLSQVNTKELRLELDVSNLATGIYFVELRAGDKLALERIIVTR